MQYLKESTYHNIPVHLYALGKIHLQTFQESWSKTFAEEKSKLQEAFSGLNIEFHHIGSTAIPGCLAKPVIDVIGAAPDITQIDRFNDTLFHLGFEAKGEHGIKNRRYFRRKELTPLNVHIFEDSDPEVQRHMRFCDYLRKHPEKVQEYSQIKRRLADQFPSDIDKYTLGKEKFIKEIDIQAAWTSMQHILEPKIQPRKQNLTHTEILQAMEVNMHLLLTYFIKYVPTMQIVFEPDVTVVRCDEPDDYFNYVLCARFSKYSASARVKHIASIFEKSHLPFSWEVGELDTPKELHEALLACGFEKGDESTGMTLNLDAWQHSSTLSELAVKQVQTIEELKDFSKVVISTGESPQIFDVLYSKVPPILYQEGAPLEMHIGYINDVPVVTGIVVMHANVAGIYYISTDPDHRKKGYGTFMMEHLLKRAKSKGYHLACLQATSDGKSLYQRLGFKECCLFCEYAKKGNS